MFYKINLNYKTDHKTPNGNIFPKNVLKKAFRKAKPIEVYFIDDLGDCSIEDYTKNSSIGACSKYFFNDDDTVTTFLNIEKELSETFLEEYELTTCTIPSINPKTKRVKSCKLLFLLFVKKQEI